MKGPLGNAERDELERALAHDLKTPLTVIAGYAELLRVREDDRTRREAPMRILEAVERLRSELDALARRVGGHKEPRLLLARQRILLVDDDDDLRTLLHATLPEDEFEMIEAADGERALELAHEHAPDLVVLDWQLPGRSGGDVLAELKSAAMPPRVLVLTAEARAADDAAAADAFVTKPFSPVHLLAVIERLLRA